MAVQVQLPDGSIGEFPDGTPDAVIESTLRKQFGKPSVSEGGIYDLPVVGSLLKSFSDTTGNFQTGFADTATFGTADEVGAGINALASDRSYDDLVKQNRDALANSGTAGTLGQLTGAIMLPGGSARTVGGAAASAGAQGAAYGFGSGEGDLLDRLPGTLAGGLMGGALGGGLRLGTDRLFARGAAPVADDMKKAAGELYDTAKAAGTKAAPADMSAIVGDIANMVDDEGLTVAGEVADWMPRVKTAMKKFTTEISGQEMTPDSMQKARRALQKVADSADESESRVGVKMLRQFDDFIEGKVPGFKDANQAYSKAMRMEKVERLLRDVDIDTMKGGAITKTTRDRFAGLLHRINNGQEYGWTATEIKAIEDVVKGKGGAAALETARKLFSINTIPGQIGALGSLGATHLLSKGLDKASGGATRAGTTALKSAIAGAPVPGTLDRLQNPRMLGGAPGLAGGALGSMFFQRR